MHLNVMMGEKDLLKLVYPLNRIVFGVDGEKNKQLSIVYTENAHFGD